MKRKSIKIALTGGIGSGKTTALKILSQAGYNTLSSDAIVTDLYKKRRIRKILKNIFPDAVSGLSLKIDRKKISEQVFSCEDKHLLLTNAITPLVLKEIIKRSNKFNGVTFCEVPLLFECRFENQFDGVLVVCRDKNARIESVISRSNFTKEHVLSRMAKQVDYDTFDLSPFTVIENDGDYNSLKEKVLSAVKKFI